MLLQTRIKVLRVIAQTWNMVVWLCNVGHSVQHRPGRNRVCCKLKVKPCWAELCILCVVQEAKDHGKVLAHWLANRYRGTYLDMFNVGHVAQNELRFIKSTGNFSIGLFCFMLAPSICMHCNMIVLRVPPCVWVSRKSVVERRPLHRMHPSLTRPALVVFPAHTPTNFNPILLCNWTLF